MDKHNIEVTAKMIGTLLVVVLVAGLCGVFIFPILNGLGFAFNFPLYMAVSAVTVIVSLAVQVILYVWKQIWLG